MPALDEQTLPSFLADWSSDHRSISDAHREQVGSYIMAIVGHDPDLAADGPDAVLDRARRLWVVFRTNFDLMRGPYQRSEAEDVKRAMSKL